MPVRTSLAALALSLAPLPSLAQDIARVSADKSVVATADAFVAAVEEAGVTVFARVDHGAGARSVGSDVGASQLVVFGSPKVGTPAIEADRLAGLALPLKVLVYEDRDGRVWLAYEPPASALGRFDGIDPDAPVIGAMAAALERFTKAAAE
ncbi:DUF302 domain-containing protein [Rhodosalinus sp. FB01]|uniref:DUF302 domain-containing protein n=1 Tax=Rhodosalinus sp. FB01 TaxID=3239194 RepID=UPI003523B472